MSLCQHGHPNKTKVIQSPQTKRAQLVLKNITKDVHSCRSQGIIKKNTVKVINQNPDTIYTAIQVGSLCLLFAATNENH